MDRSLVLIHGTDGRPEAWDPVLSRLDLDATWHVATPTLAGWASRRDVTLESDLRAHTDDVVAQVDTDDRPVVLAGYSHGGSIALEITLARRWNLESLVLIEPNAMSVLLLTEHRSIGEEYREMAMRFDAAARAGDPEAAAIAVSFVYGRGAWERLDERVKAHLVAIGPTWAEEAMSIVPRDYTVDELSSVGVPVLVVNGTQTVPPFTRVGEALARLLPDARRVLIEGAGHAALASHPAQIADLVAPVLAAR